MKKYKLGNFLRGGFKGEFGSLEEAWNELGTDFLNACPCEDYNPDSKAYYTSLEGGRTVCMYVYEENAYGIEEFVKCRVDSFHMNERLRTSGIEHTWAPAVEFFG